VQIKVLKVTVGRIFSYLPVNLPVHLFLHFKL